MSVNLAIVDPAHMPASFPQSGTMEAHEHLGNMLDLDSAAKSRSRFDMQTTTRKRSRWNSS